MKKLLVILLLFFPVHGANSLTINKWIVMTDTTYIYWNKDYKYAGKIYCEIFDDKDVKIGSAIKQVIMEDHGEISVYLPIAIQTENMIARCNTNP